jgi:cell division protease FtsH
MITEFGMSEELGHLTFGKRKNQVFLGRDIAEEKNYSDETALLIDKEVRKVVDEAYNKATKLLSKHKKELEKLAQNLKKEEILYADQVERITGLKKNADKADKNRKSE